MDGVKGNHQIRNLTNARVKKLNKKSEIISFLNDYINQSWSIKWTNTLIQKTPFVYVGPSSPFQGIFNKLVISSSGLNSYNFSIIDFSDNSGIRKLHSSLKELNRLIKGDLILTKQNKEVGSICSDQSDEFKIQTIWQVVQEIFSKEFIEENKLTLSLLTKKIRDVALPSFDEIKQENPLPVFRLVEVRKEFRIILWVSPLDFDVKLCFTGLEEERTTNIFTNYFEWYFWPYTKYDRFVRKHIVDFSEKQGYKQFPLASYNTQVFSMKFNCFNYEDSALNVLADSGKSQMKFLNKMLREVFIFLGKDVFGQGLINKEKELEFYDVDNSVIPGATKGIGQFLGRRIYSTPEYDAILDFLPEVLKGEDFITRFSITVHPWVSKERPDIGWYTHPIIYDIEK